MTAIVAGDILWKYSVAAAAGNSTGSAAGTSLGDQISTTAWAGSVLNDLFDDISGAENAANTVDYRGVFIQNTNANNVYENPTVYLSAEVAGGASIAIAIDNIAASTLASGSTQMATIANETTTPSGVGSFSSPTTAAGGLALSNLAVAGGTCVRGVWVRRTAASSAALSADGVTLAVSGDTGSL